VQVPDRHKRGIHTRPASFYTGLTNDPKLGTFRKRQGNRFQAAENKEKHLEDVSTSSTSESTLEEA